MIDELINGYNHEMNIKEIIDEAKRCLNCKNPTCKAGCPVDNDIPEFINALAKGNIGQAHDIISQKSNLPAVCGRVCPHELQCEGNCVLNKKGKSIKIGEIERFIADFNYAMNITSSKVSSKTRGKIAIIGSGPAGLTAAADLSKLGFNITVFESEQEPGGVLMYGIPEFRLPKDIVRREISRIEALGVNFITNTMVGPKITIDSILDSGFDAIFIATGTSLAKELFIPGNTLKGIMQSSYLLRILTLLNSNQIDKKDVPVTSTDTVLVIGGGNVAMDAARSAKKAGAKDVCVIYRGTRENMTALNAEYEEAIKDGIKFELQATPIEYIGENNILKGLKVSTPFDEKILNCNKLFLAIGSKPASRIISTTPSIQVDENGYVITLKKPYGMTTKKAVFAGGDVVHQPATVVLAMKEAKKVASGIASYVDAIKLLNI